MFKNVLFFAVSASVNVMQSLCHQTSAFVTIYF